jgi:DNA mismatch repair ATPase MutS
MSKLLTKFQELKRQDPSKLYVFKSGIFYLFLQEDAKTVSPILNLKITNLNETTVKCGFPVANLDKYLSLLKMTPYEVEFIENSESKPTSSKKYLSLQSLEGTLTKIANLKIDDLSVSEAFALLTDLQEQIWESQKDK